MSTFLRKRKFAFKIKLLSERKVNTDYFNIKEIYCSHKGQGEEKGINKSLPRFNECLSVYLFIVNSFCSYTDDFLKG